MLNIFKRVFKWNVQSWKLFFFQDDMRSNVLKYILPKLTVSYLDINCKVGHLLAR